jgi:FtsH-binding integral membrane protein
MNEKDLASIIREQESGINARERERYMPAAFSVLMRKVYVWMTLALVITGFTAYYVAHSTSFVYTLMSSSGLMWGLIIAELALVIGLSAAIHKLSLTVATLMFVVYSIINGLTLSFIFFAYTESSIAQVFFITAGTFGAMALIGYTTKTDLTSLGKYLFMGLIGIIIATLVNLFFNNDMVTTIVSYLGVLIFVGLTAYDSQKIKKMCMSFEYADTNAQKMALLGALTLYLDFINLFIYLLRIFGRRN